MLNTIIKFALSQRLIVLIAAVFLTVYGMRAANDLPIDVLPEITRPRVAILTEVPGYATEDVERYVTKEIELAINGASGVEAIRSTSDIGLSVIQVEFDWGFDVFKARQVVQERLATVQGRLPDWVEPQLAPNSTLLGQIMMIGVRSKSGRTSGLELRSLADWIIRRRLMQVKGVAQVLNIGGGKQQFQVLIDPHALHQFEIPLERVSQALQDSNLNVAGGYLEEASREFVVRGIGRIRTVAEIEQIVVKPQSPRSVLIGDIAQVAIGEKIKRGDASINGDPGVVMTIQKQPTADTRDLTERIREALDSLRQALPEDVQVDITYQQREFIDYSVGNVIDAIRDGAIFVVIILIVFLLNIRTTLITLTAIPLSLLSTFLVFHWFGLTINVMTLGGIAVALGELVDDAIVDVENIFKRLRLNRLAEAPQPVLQVIYEASSEVRGAIINSTLIVILVFAPLFALSGIEGRLFAPLGVAYVVSILASTVVSLTVTPVLSYYLLGRSSRRDQSGDPFVVHWLKKLIAPVIRFSLTRIGFLSVSVIILILFLLSLIKVIRMGKDLLPPFDEGATQVNLFLPAGASLQASNQVSEIALEKLKNLLVSEDNPDGPLLWITQRSGRAEEDEHVMNVNVSELTLSLNPDQKLSQDSMKHLLEDELAGVVGAELEIEQPIAHLISHMISGVAAEIGIKIYGDDLLQLRLCAEQVRDILASIDGLTNPIIEQQQMVPQLRIQVKKGALARFGLTAREVYETVETAMRGRVVNRILDGERQFDLLVRFEEDYRANLEFMKRMPIESRNGMRIPLADIADVFQATGPNTINRENSRRRIIVRVNTIDRDLISAVNEIKARLTTDFQAPEGSFYEISGQYEAQTSATRNIIVMSLVSLVGIFVVLFTNFPSINLVAQILVAIPVGFIGGVIGLAVTGQTLSIAAMVGFISLGGIAVRNGILLMEAFEKQHDIHGDTQEAIVAGSLDRLAPVLMTTLTTGFAILPLVTAGDLPGREILFPVATVILFGLISSALAEYLLRPGMYWFLRKRASGLRS